MHADLEPQSANSCVTKPFIGQNLSATRQRRRASSSYASQPYDLPRTGRTDAKRSANLTLCIRLSLSG